MEALLCLVDFARVWVEKKEWSKNESAGSTGLKSGSFANWFNCNRTGPINGSRFNRLVWSIFKTTGHYNFPRPKVDKNSYTKPFICGITGRLSLQVSWYASSAGSMISRASVDPLVICTVSNKSRVSLRIPRIASVFHKILSLHSSIILCFPSTLTIRFFIFLL